MQWDPSPPPWDASIENWNASLICVDTNICIYIIYIYICMIYM